MTEKSETEWKSAEPKEHRESPSLFAPIVLIALGVYLLLGNLNLLPDLQWHVAWRLWPVLLIFIGLNILVRQVPGVAGTLLSGIVALGAVAVFSWVLLAGSDIPLFGRFMDVDLRQQEISFAEEDVSAATVDIDFSAFPAEITALSDSRNLIEGVITSSGEVEFETEREGNEARVRLGARSGGPFFWFNPADFAGDQREMWRIALSPRVPLTLRADVGSGPVDLQLSDLMLNNVDLDGGSGPSTIAFPAGDYEVSYDGGSGPATFILPESGQQTYEIEGGSGPISLVLPADAELRVEVTDDGSGGFRPGARLELVEGQQDDEGTWETAGFSERGDSAITVFLDIGSGPVSVDEE